MSTPSLPSALLCAAVCLTLSVLSGCVRKPQPLTLPPQVTATAAQPLNCPASIDTQSDVALAPFSPPTTNGCSVRSRSGFQLPDSACTPGAVNQTLTLDILKDDNFKTDCVRDKATSAQKKAQTYAWYGIPHPSDNTGQNQVCELDHLVPLYLGGADTLDNIWPQCGPDAVTLNQRFFKKKDQVELYLGAMVCQGQMSLADAQKSIATDWTLYINAASHYCRINGCQNLGAVEELK